MESKSQLCVSHLIIATASGTHARSNLHWSELVTHLGIWNWWWFSVSSFHGKWFRHLQEARIWYISHLISGKAGRAEMRLFGQPEDFGKMSSYSSKSVLIDREFRRNEQKKKRKKASGKENRRKKNEEGRYRWKLDENVFLFRWLIFTQLKIHYNLEELGKCK